MFAASMQGNTYNYILLARGEIRIDAGAQFVTCDAVNGVGVLRPFGDVYDDLIGTGSRSSFSFGPAAAVTAALSALNTANQHTHTLTYNYPSPGPGVAAAPTPFISSYSDQHTYGIDNTAVLAASAVSGFVGAAQLNFPGNNAPVQLKVAAQHIADDLYSRACKAGWADIPGFEGSTTLHVHPDPDATLTPSSLASSASATPVATISPPPAPPPCPG